MAHRTLAALALGLLSIAGGCKESEGEPAPAPQGPEQVDFASLATLDTTKLTFCCDPNAPFPQTVGTFTLTTNFGDSFEYSPTGQVEAAAPDPGEFLDADGNPTEDEGAAVKLVQTYEVTVDACPPPTGWKVEVKVTGMPWDLDTTSPGLGVAYGVEDVLIENVCPPVDERVELTCGTGFDQLYVAQGPIVNVTTAEPVLVVGTAEGACGGTVAGGLTDILAPFAGQHYGACLLRHVPSNTQAALAYGPNGIALRGYVGGWGSTLVDPFVAGVDRNTTDAIPTAGDPDSAQAIVTRLGRSRVEIMTYDATTDAFSNVVTLPAQLFPGANGRPISACRPEIGGPIYVLFNSTASQLYVKTDPENASTPATLMATLGNDGRRVRHEGDNLFVSLFADDALAVVNRTTFAVTTFDVGDGPIGIDTETLPNGNIAVLTTGYNDHTYTITVIGSDGTLFSTDTMEAGGLNPGSGVFVDDEKVAISLNGSSKVRIFDWTAIFDENNDF